MVSYGVPLSQVGAIIKRHERGFLTELEMEALVLSAVFDRPLSTDDVLEIRVFMHEKMQ